MITIGFGSKDAHEGDAGIPKFLNSMETMFNSLQLLTNNILFIINPPTYTTLPELDKAHIKYMNVMR